MHLPQGLSDRRIIIYVLCHTVMIVVGAVTSVLGEDSTQALGLALVATGIAGYVVLGYVLVSHRVTDQLALLDRFGIVGAWPSRATRIKEEYESRLQRVEDRIDVLGFGLNALREDMLGAFPTWKSRAEVRILLIDPEFPSAEGSLAAQRDREEGRNPDTTRTHVQDFLAATAEIRDERFQVRLYRCIPTVGMFRIDGDVLWGPYLAYKPGRNTFTLLAKQGGSVFDELVRHFEHIWTSDMLSAPVGPMPTGDTQG